jgi:hypothetical protein
MQSEPTARDHESAWNPTRFQPKNSGPGIDGFLRPASARDCFCRHGLIDVSLLLEICKENN